MTVGELIKKLAQYSFNAEVLIEYYQDDQHKTLQIVGVECIEHSANNETVYIEG